MNLTLKKLFTFFFCIAVLAGSVSARENTLEQTLQKQAQAARPASGKTAITRKDFFRPAYQPITMQDADKLDNQIKLPADKSVITEQNFAQYFDVTPTGDDPNKILRTVISYIGDFPPASARKPFIVWLGETHYSGQIPQFVAVLVKSYQDNFPDKRVLVAAEAAVSDTLLQASTPAAERPKLNEALTWLLDNRINLLPLEPAQKLDIRQSGNVTEVWGRVGGKTMLLDRLSAKEAAEHEKTRWAKYHAYREHYGATNWGLQERNREWARRLNLVKDKYDVIFVYGGIGHFSARLPYSVPALMRRINDPSIAFFDLNPKRLEELNRFFDEHTPTDSVLEDKQNRANPGLRTDFASRLMHGELFSERKETSVAVLKPDVSANIRQEASMDTWVLFK